jgi:hypothetical protein
MIFGKVRCGFFQELVFHLQFPGRSYSASVISGKPYSCSVHGVMTPEIEHEYDNRRDRAAMSAGVVREGLTARAIAAPNGGRTPATAGRLLRLGLRKRTTAP